MIPATATHSAEHLTVTISNFGNLAVVTVGTPGSHKQEEERDLLVHASE